MNEYNNMMMNTAIVDFGSGSVKADFSGEDSPKCRFDSVIGRPKFNKVLPLSSENEVVGPDPSLRGLYRLERPVKRGIISSQVDIKLLMNRIYSDLKVMNSKEVPVFIAEPPFTPKSQKRAISELLFEGHDCPSVFFGTQGVLSLYAFGKTDGIMLESGEGVTQVVPVFNGYKLEHAVDKLNFAGEDVANQLKLLLRRNGFFIQTASEDSLYRDIKRAVCELKPVSIEDLRNRGKIVGNDFSDKVGEDATFQLPDGSTLDVGFERFMASEVLFNPSIGGFEYPGLHEVLDGAIKKLDIDLRRNLYANIFLSGGNTMISGFAERIANELGILNSSTTKMSIVAPNVDRTVLAWQGASTITSMNSFSKLWITKKDLQENGDRIFHMKAF